MKSKDFFNTKVGIIGAGVNGLYLAWKLSEKGYKVSVFERKEKIGNDVCSGLFSQRIFDFIPQSQELIRNRINQVILNFPKKKVKVSFSKEFFVMSHYQLDQLLAGLAKRAGAEIFLNHNIKEIPQGFDRIIGCDGINSFIREHFDLKKPKYRLGILGFVNQRSNNNYVETWPCRKGFIWKIPRGCDIEYGIMADPEEANNILEDFLKKNNISINKKAKLIPYGFALPDDSQITLCGDAAGLTKLWSGGGVVWGLFAADILLKTFPDFKEYRRQVKIFFLPKIILSRIAVNSVYFLGFRIPWLLPKNNKMESDFLF